MPTVPRHPSLGVRAMRPLGHVPRQRLMLHTVDTVSVHGVATARCGSTGLAFRPDPVIDADLPRCQCVPTGWVMTA